MDETLFAVLIVAFFAYAIGMTIWTRGRVENMLNRWASDEGYEVLESKNCWLLRGPFSWTTSDGQRVYRVVVRTPEGRIRQGWVRCGSFGWGILTHLLQLQNLSALYSTCYEVEKSVVPHFFPVGVVFRLLRPDARWVVGRRRMPEPLFPPRRRSRCEAHSPFLVPLSLSQAGWPSLVSRRSTRGSSLGLPSGP